MYNTSATSGHLASGPASARWVPVQPSATTSASMQATVDQAPATSAHTASPAVADDTFGALADDDQSEVEDSVST